MNPVPPDTFFSAEPLPVTTNTGTVAGLTSATISVVFIAFLFGSVALEASSIDTQGLPSSLV